MIKPLQGYSASTLFLVKPQTSMKNVQFQGWDEPDWSLRPAAPQWPEPDSKECQKALEEVAESFHPLLKKALSKLPPQEFVKKRRFFALAAFHEIGHFLADISGRNRFKPVFITLIGSKTSNTPHAASINPDPRFPQETLANKPIKNYDSQDILERLSSIKAGKRLERKLTAQTIENSDNGDNADTNALMNTLTEVYTKNGPEALDSVKTLTEKTPDHLERILQQFSFERVVQFAKILAQHLYLNKEDCQKITDALLKNKPLPNIKEHFFAWGQKKHRISAFWVENSYFKKESSLTDSIRELLTSFRPVQWSLSTFHFLKTRVAQSSLIKRIQDDLATQDAEFNQC